MRMAELHPELARALLEGLPAGLVLVDETDHIVWANRAMGDLTRRPVGELTGQDAAALSLRRPEDDDEDTETIDTTGRAGKHLVGIPCPIATSQFNGKGLLVLERGQVPVSLLKSLPSVIANGSVNAGVVVSRDAIRHRLEMEISRSRRYENPLSCLVVKVSYAAQEQAADPITHDMFKEATRIVKEQLRWVDVLGRWSEDAIIVVLPETSADAVQGLAAKLSHATQSSWPGGLAAVKITCGTSTWQKADDVDRLVLRAVRAIFEEVEIEAQAQAESGC